MYRALCRVMTLNKQVFVLLTLYQMTKFRLFQTKEFADDNSRSDGNGGKISKGIENMWEKEKLLITSNSDSSRCFCLVCKITGLFST